MTPTPEMIEKFKKARAAMIADPTFLNNSIAKLSPEAQVHAKAIRDIVYNEEDAVAGRAKITAIRAPLSPALLKELDAHRDRLIEKYGLPKCE
ncbi:hypothetical protein PRIPAC_86582 [Pristionchus pacificus]|uniref:Uncharacterized protein n=1 Tax=Pristionchus pacificus TaxID=54126 RepID=A0A2A6BTV3_PRIPA|nr:hypothetical protein PRIPAC_86582 [Pristionchus pacificus]|eukprot:PDM69325.1 hypothetical protein PRIPAC_47627 [Pristionchus pacificus]